MPNDLKGKRKVKKAAKVLSLVTAAVLCILLLIVVSVKIYLSTSHPASQLSRYMTSYLHQDFSVQSVGISGSTIVLRGVRLKNPAGFPEGNLAVADSVAIAPVWALSHAEKRFRLIALQGIKVNLDKNAAGVWNFSQIRQLLASRKPAPEAAETFIKELVVKDGAFKVQGQGVQGVSLRLFDIATKGSSASNIDLAFEDAARNRYLLKGKARAGDDAALDLALTAPSLSLQDLARLLKVKNPALFEGGKGALKVNATMQKGLLNLNGDLSFSQMHLPAERYPLRGVLHFAADYSTQSDILRLQTGTLTVEELVKLRAEGRVRNTRGERNFAFYISMDEAELYTLNLMLSDQARKNLLFGGRLRCDSLHLLGDRNGLKSAVGTLQLQDGSVAKEGGELYASGLSGTIGASRKDSTILAKGKLAVSGPQSKALLEALDMPFALTISPKLKPLRADIPALSARYRNIPIIGRVTFDAAKADPYDASLRVPEVKLTAVNSLLKRYGLNAASGTASAALEVTGKSVQELNGTAKLRISELRGSRGKDTFAAKRGDVAATVRRSGGRVQAQGDVKLSDATFNGKKGELSSGFRVADQTIYLNDARISAAGTRVSISTLKARIPAQTSAGEISSYPVSLDMEGGAIRQGDVEIANLSGVMRGSFNTDRTGRWLAGTADLKSRAVTRQGKAVAAPVLHAVFSRAGGRGELSGKILGGKLGGTVSYNPFATDAAASFDLGVTGAGLADAASFFPNKTALHPSGGQLDLHVKGGYSRRGGLAYRFDSKGSGISLTGAGRKTIVSGARLDMSGALAGGNLKISDASLSAGEGVTLKLKGELARALTPKREGSFTFSLQEAALNSVIDPFANVLPRLIQEATVDGTVAADGKFTLHEGRKVLQGGVMLRGVKMDVPSQKLLVADINGRLPLSFDFSGKGGAKPQSTISFSRENYPRLLEQFRKRTGGGEGVTIGKVSFGTLELGKTTMQLSAVNGTTEISSLNTSLYKGTIFGKGYVTMQQKLAWRGDLLINGVSMKALCNTLPNLEGYISGRVDGVISLNGAGKGVAGTTGFAELWAREGAGEKMVVSKEFLQRLAKQKLSGFFFSTDRRYDEAEIKATLVQGDLSFETLKIVNTNMFGVRDLNVSIVPGQNRIELDHLLDSIKQAAVRGKPAAGDEPAKAPATQEFKWGE